VKLVAQNGQIWQETTNSAYSPVLRKPNHFRTDPVLRKLDQFEAGAREYLRPEAPRRPQRRHGALRPQSGSRAAARQRRRASVLPLSTDNISGITEAERHRSGARDHPRPLQLPVPPACRHLAALCRGAGGDAGHEHSALEARLAANGVRPSGILITFPGKHRRRRRQADQGDVGRRNTRARPARAKIAVLGDGAEVRIADHDGDDAQLIEQLKYTAEIVCSAYHVPPYKIGWASSRPTTTSRRSTSSIIRSACRSTSRTSSFASTKGSASVRASNGLRDRVRHDNLLRMDSVTQMDVLEKGEGQRDDA
jgi:hypothetical protein